MRKTLKLGKIDYLGIGKKTCPVEIEISLTDQGKGPVFTASGTIWNHKHTDCYQGGQCIDSILEYMPDNETVKEIHELWKKYHLNDMHAETPNQERALREAGLTKFATDYKECCRYLESKNLLVEDGYRFGTGWLYEPIPGSDLDKITNLMK